MVILLVLLGYFLHLIFICVYYDDKYITVALQLADNNIEYAVDIIDMMMKRKQILINVMNHTLNNNASLLFKIINVDTQQ
jgi:hypothetical protein